MCNFLEFVNVIVYHGSFVLKLFNLKSRNVESIFADRTHITPESSGFPRDYQQILGHVPSDRSKQVCDLFFGYHETRHIS